MRSEEILAEVVLEPPTPPLPFPLPRRTLETAWFWRSGADGKLRIQRCPDCSSYIHPPSPRCPYCGGTDPSAVVVSGRGSVYSYTVSLQPFLPGLPPYCVGLVAIEEEPAIRLVGVLFGARASEVHAGQPVQAEFFQQSDEVWIPCFRLQRDGVRA